MLDFPPSTVFNKWVPKKKFYENLSISSRIEKQFVTEIESVYWTHKLSPETLNVSPGTRVTEIEVFEVNLKEQQVSDNLIATIDREIPYHLVFVLRYEGRAQLMISYKEESKSREDKFKVDSYYRTDWIDYEKLTLRIEGLDLDRIYENFISQIAGDDLNLEKAEDIRDAVMIAKERDRLETYITKLEAKIRKEKQFNFQLELNQELRKAKEKLKDYLE
ncbi:DUF4391 domain-containing protein [Mesotoga sp.]|uniref:DUF4391 domain-containing protein n=1 Tax=Mesotoga sp. TaxID=2053577 RepID=UPI002CA8FB76|nr:DUF4391 domain-containing protein [Mesotoga sp.]HRX66700.1 DUF4391 domain-containing protein [Mesotoga sp.]